MSGRNARDGPPYTRTNHRETRRESWSRSFTYCGNVLREPFLCSLKDLICLKKLLLFAQKNIFVQSHRNVSGVNNRLEITFLNAAQVL